MTDGGFDGGLDIGALMSQLGQMQQNLHDAQEAAAAQEVEGSAGGGKVTVRLTGALEFLDIRIDASVADPGEIEMLQDLVLAAVRDGVEKAGRMATDAIGGAGLPPGLGGLLGR